MSRRIEVMRRPVNIRKRGQIILLVALTSAFAMAARAQNMTADVHKKVEASLAKDVTWPVIAPTVEIKLRALTPTACIGSSLKLEIEITNTGQDVVTIDKVDVWSSFSFSYNRPDPDGTGMGWDSGCSHCRGNYIVIEPGATYWEAHEISLASFEFFKTAEKYTLTTEIDSVPSNEVIFELYECGNTKEEAK